MSSYDGSRALCDKPTENVLQKNVQNDEVQVTISVTPSCRRPEAIPIVKAKHFSAVNSPRNYLRGFDPPTVPCQPTLLIRRTSSNDLFIVGGASASFAVAVPIISAPRADFMELPQANKA